MSEDNEIARAAVEIVRRTMMDRAEDSPLLVIEQLGPARAGQLVSSLAGLVCVAVEEQAAVVAGVAEQVGLTIQQIADAALAASADGKRAVAERVLDSWAAAAEC